MYIFRNKLNTDFNRPSTFPPHRSVLPTLFFLAVLTFLTTAPCCDNLDRDDDGVCDETDNCPDTANPDQRDANFNGIGDACDPSDVISLPADDALHGESIEWWYWTGHLQGDAGQRFGFEFVVFAFKMGPFEATLVNHAITDIENQTFHYTAGFEAAEPELVENGFDFQLDEFSATGGDGWDTLHGQVDDWTMDVQLTSAKPAVFHHENGFTEYAVGGFTYYYSRQRMDVMGTLSHQGQPMEVTGSAWFDHQWGELDQIVDGGWDWFAVQLDDDRELMIMVLDDDGTATVAGASLTDESGVTTYLEEGDLLVSSTGQWQSPVSGCTYPMGWDIELPGLAITVTPVMEDQELVSTHETYWEGAAVVTGDVTGRAYVELAGYCN